MNGFPASTDVFVIGGGPAGLAAAIAARRSGFRVVVADSSLPPIDKACGEGIMPDGLAAAQSLGIDLSDTGAFPFRGIRFTGQAPATTAQAFFPHGHGLGLRRTILHDRMIQQATRAGVHLAWGSHTTGIQDDGVLVDGGLVRARWIVGADGGRSSVRRWAGLDACARDSRRYGFRRHYQLAPWSDYMEIHWGPRCQVYITPVSRGEICAVAISRDPRLRLENALEDFPELAGRLSAAPCDPAERGGVSATRRLRSVCRGRVALVGDASGSVDAITGDGLCLLFQHATALASALERGDLAHYQRAHRAIGRRPQFMADLMLLLEHRSLRRRVLRAFESQPKLFARLLAMHVGELPVSGFLTNSLALGWHVLTV